MKIFLYSSCAPWYRLFDIRFIWFCFKWSVYERKIKRKKIEIGNCLYNWERYDTKEKFKELSVLEKRQDACFK